jgi:hypothetical protein
MISNPSPAPFPHPNPESWYVLPEDIALETQKSYVDDIDMDLFLLVGSIFGFWVSASLEGGAVWTVIDFFVAPCEDCVGRVIADPGNRVWDLWVIEIFLDWTFKGGGYRSKQVEWMNGSREMDEKWCNRES